MKRPLFVLGATVLSGTLAGLPEAKGVMKAAMCLLDIVLLYLAYRKSRGSRISLLFCVLISVCGVFAFLRACSFSRKLSGAEYRDFYERYEATNPGQFDYALYLKTIGITDEDSRKELSSKEELSENQGSRKLSRAREFLGSVLEGLMSEHDSGIYKAMLLGDKTDMDEGVKDLYQESGIAHILAVSGLHISLIGAGLFQILKNRFHVSGKSAFLAAGSAAFLYSIFTGGSGSSIRASVMLTLSMLALLLGRTSDSLSSLSLSLILLLFFNPYIALQSGFQLSFLAIFGIIVSNGLMENGVFCRKKKKSEAGIKEQFLKGFRSALLSGTCVTLVTLPVICCSYFAFPLYSVVLNLLVIPLMSVVMISGLCALLFGTLMLFLKAQGFLFPAKVTGMLAVLSVSPGHYVLKLYEDMCSLFSKIPFSRIITGKPDSFHCVLYAAFLGILYLFLTETTSFPKNGAESIIRFAGTFVSLFLCVALLIVREPGTFYVCCLDVGQGDCFHIHKNDTDILIDGGSQRYEKVGENIIEPYFLSKGISELDLVIVSHADADHVNGLYDLLSGQSAVKVRNLCLPALSAEDKRYDRLKESFCSDSKTVLAAKGMRLKVSDMELCCIYCNDSKEALSDTNRQSSVFLLDNEGFQMLFCGDISEKEEREIVRSCQDMKTLCNVDVLKVSHHGSKTASCRDFIELTDPKYAVLSYKKGNSYGHPDREVVERFTENETVLLRTAESGAIKIIPGKEEIRIESFKKKGGMP